MVTQSEVEALLGAIEPVGAGDAALPVDLLRSWVNSLEEPVSMADRESWADFVDAVAQRLRDARADRAVGERVLQSLSQWSTFLELELETGELVVDVCPEEFLRWLQATWIDALHLFEERCDVMRAKDGISVYVRRLPNVPGVPPVGRYAGKREDDRLRRFPYAFCLVAVGLSDSKSLLRCQLYPGVASEQDRDHLWLIIYEVRKLFARRDSGRLPRFYDDVIDKRIERFEAAGPPDGEGRRAPTLKTRERAELYRRLKDAHPEWSQSKVAIEANREEGTDVHSKSSVQNAYRAMGWEWERADRVR